MSSSFGSSRHPISKTIGVREHRYGSRAHRRTPASCVYQRVPYGPFFNDGNREITPSAASFSIVPRETGENDPTRPPNPPNTHSSRDVTLLRHKVLFLLFLRKPRFYAASPASLPSVLFPSECELVTLTPALAPPRAHPTGGASLLNPTS